MGAFFACLCLRLAGAPYHLHVYTAALQLLQHLIEALLARFGSLGIRDPAKVVVLLLVGPGKVRARQQASVFQGISDEARHRAALALQWAHA